MKKQRFNPGQLSFSYGRPLPILLDEVQRKTRNPELRKAAAQMAEALHAFELARQTGTSKSVRIKTAIQEILSK